VPWRALGVRSSSSSSSTSSTSSSASASAVSTVAMAERVRDLKLLSRERWEAHVAAQAAEGTRVGGAPAPAPQPLQPLQPLQPALMPAPTAGALFNRPNPMNEAGEFVLPYVRARNKFVDFRGEQHWVDKNGFAIDTPKEGKNWQANRRYVPVSGKDWTSVKVSSVFKYRIPNTSVVNKVGDIKSFLCCGYRLTAAQWSAPRPVPRAPRAARAPCRARPMPRALRVLTPRPRPSQFGGSTSSAWSCIPP